jgi:hypothetical protein
VVAKKLLPESAEEIEKAATRGFQSLGGKMKYDTAALDDLNSLDQARSLRQVDGIGKDRRNQDA